MMDELDPFVVQVFDTRHFELLEALNEFAVEIAPRLTAHESKRALREVDLERDAIISTVDYVTVNGNQPPELLAYLEVVNLLTHLEHYLSLRGLWVEKREWCLRLSKQGRLVRPPNGILAIVYNMLGAAFSELHDDNNALFFYDLALKESGLAENDPELGKIYANLGVTYWQTGQLEKALHYMGRALDTELQQGDHHAIAMLLANIAQVFFDAGYRMEALENSINALTLAKELGDVFLEAQFTSIVAVHAMGVDLYEQAADLYEKALELSVTIQDEIGMALTRLNYAILRIHLKQLQQAKQLLIESLPTFERHFMQPEVEKVRVLLNTLNA